MESKPKRKMSYEQSLALGKAQHAARAAARRRRPLGNETAACTDCGGVAPASYPVCDDCLKKRLS
jgi:hypothetical protein